MKKTYQIGRKLVFVPLFVMPLLSFGQDILWEKSYGGQHAEYLFDAIPTADYGFILAGSSLSGKSGNKTSDSSGDLDYWVWKMDENGDLDWQKSFGGIGSDFLQSVKLTNDGGFILAGNSDSPKGFSKKDDGFGGEDFWIIKLDAGGGEQWQKTIGGVNQEKLHSIAQTKDGGYILGGSSGSDKSESKAKDSYGNQDYWIVKLDIHGTVEWEQTFGGIYFDELRCIEQTADQGYILGGYSNSPASGNKTEDNIGIGDYWVIKLDKTGKEEWQQTLGGNKDDQLYAIHQTYDGGYILGGNSNSGANYSKKKSNGKGTDFWILKLDKEGQMDWQQTYDFGESDILMSIVENKDHTFLVGGFAKSEAAGKRKDEKGINDYIALKISETGEELWQKTVGSDGEDILRKVIETRDGGYLLAGTSNPLRRNADNVSEAGRGSILGDGSGISLGNGQQLQGLKNATDNINDKVQGVAESFNEAYKETFSGAADAINKATNLGEDSPLKFGVNAPNNPLENVPSIGSGGGTDLTDKAMDGLSSGLGGKKANIPPSRDKKSHYGNNDFWVVKLKDKDKPKVVKATIEAMPNPAGDFTNVIIGYDYETGTATVVDLAGHILQSFKITDRTIPVDLSRYPAGIYIINIKTNKQNDSIKVIKN